VSDHPTPAELEGFVWNRGLAGRGREIVAHLAAGCDRCRSVLAPHLAGMLGLAEPPERSLSSHEESEYDAAIDRAFLAVLRQSEETREERKREALALLAASSLEALPDVPPHLRGIPLFEALLERSWSFRHDSPEEMIRVADLARELAEKFDPKSFLDEAVEDLQCRAWIELGNAYRVADRFEDAEGALGRATDLFLAGTRDELLAARLFDVQASLLGASRRFDLAATSLDLVFAIHRRRGNEHLAGRALISKGIYLGYQGEAEEAIILMGQGLALISEDRDPQLVYLVHHNQARLLLDCGRPKEALKALWKLKVRRLDVGGHLNDLKVRWLEGQIYAGLNDFDRAEMALRTVRQGFEEAGLVYKAALAGLELGAVLLRKSERQEGAETVMASASVFLSLGIAREASASVLLLQKAFEKQKLELALLEYVIGQLRRLERSEGEPLEPPKVR
jgi:tetratricopeptide (TPR) repeat protein